METKTKFGLLAGAVMLTVLAVAGNANAIYFSHLPEYGACVDTGARCANGSWASAYVTDSIGNADVYICVATAGFFCP